MITTYVALIHQVKKKSTFGVIFPDFPGCVFAGKTMDEALENARKGLLFHIDGMLEDGELLPEPSSMDRVMANKENQVATPSLIGIVVPSGRSQRLNISMDSGLLEEIDRCAAQTGRSRSQFLADAARDMLS